MQGANQNVRKLLCADLVSTNDYCRFHCFVPSRLKILEFIQVYKFLDAQKRNLKG